MTTFVKTQIKLLIILRSFILTIYFSNNLKLLLFNLSNDQFNNCKTSYHFTVKPPIPIKPKSPKEPIAKPRKNIDVEMERQFKAQDPSAGLISNASKVFSEGIF